MPSQPRSGRHRFGHPKAEKRPATNLERVFGKHSVKAVFLTRPDAVRRLIIAGEEDYHREFIDLAAQTGIAAEFMGWPDFLRLGGFTRDDKHQGIFVFTDPRTIYAEKDFELIEEAKVLLALDQISNPQNLATILRGAAFFGVDAVMMLRDRSADVSSEVVRYAVGGAEFVKVFRVTNLSQSLDMLKHSGFWVLGLDERGEKTLAETDFPDKLIFVVGAEGEGLRPKTKKYCDALVRIPGGRPGLESLNAGVATSIALAEIFRGQAGSR
jgi:23S rRNA (guanosine2251-2'-O)-methyltransferase